VNAAADGQRTGVPCPPGHKLIAWEGVGFFVPERWDIGKHGGDHRRGWFRVDTEQRVIIQARWWRATRPASFDQIVDQHVSSQQAEHGQELVFAVSDAFSPAPAGDRQSVFATAPDESGHSEWLVLCECMQHQRVLQVRVQAEAGVPSAAACGQMFSGLRLQGADAWRDFSVFDFTVRSPPAHTLDRAILSAGVCYLRFRHRRRYLGLRRFSAATAVMGCADPDIKTLDSWCRAAYAAEFHDMRYQVARSSDAQDRPLLRLTGRPRLLAPLELKWLVPKHRQLPRQIDIVWDAAANKIYAVEVLKPADAGELIDAFRAGISHTLAGVDAPAAGPAPADDGEDDSLTARRRRLRARSLAAEIALASDIRYRVNEIGRVVLDQHYERPDHLRWLRAVGGQQTGNRQAERQVELDLVGSRVWQACQTPCAAAELVEIVRAEFQISYREAEMSVTTFIRDLGSRGLLVIKMPDAGADAAETIANE
jgi:hypothetical protein